MSEDGQLPCARMMTINRPSFWIYFIMCTVLIASYLMRPFQRGFGWPTPSLIALSVFFMLFLELLSQRVKNERTGRLLVNACYILETGCGLAFLFAVFS